MTAVTAIVGARRRLRPPAVVGGDPADRAASPWWVGFSDARASLVALTPIGFMAGAAGAEASGPVAGWAAGPLMMSATAHFTILSMSGAGLAGVLAVVAVLQSRCAIFGAALAHRFAGQPRWFRVVGAYLLVDQTFALVDARRDQFHRAEDFRAHYLGVVTPLAGWWLIVMAAGVAAGSVIPAGMRLELIAVALVVALLRPALATPAARRGALAAAAVTALCWFVPHGAGLLVGAAAGMVIGARTEGDR